MSWDDGDSIWERKNLDLARCKGHYEANTNHFQGVRSVQECSELYKVRTHVQLAETETQIIYCFVEWVYILALKFWGVITLLDVC